VRRFPIHCIAGESGEHLPNTSQKKKGATSCSSIVNVRCNPRDVIFTTGLLNPQQYAEADGFAELLRMKTDAASS